MFFIRSVAPILLPGPSLTAEIELLNILRKIKLLLYAFKEIYQWTSNRENRKRFQFSPHRPVRARNTILRDICENMDLPSDNFEQHVMNWLPGNIPTPLSIHSFKSALNSHLSNAFISKAENLSYPVPTSLFCRSHLQRNKKIKLLFPSFITENGGVIHGLNAVI